MWKILIAAVAAIVFVMTGAEGKTPKQQETVCQGWSTSEVSEDLALSVCQIQAQLRSLWREA